MTTFVNRLCGKKAIVTASTRGIGYEIAKRLAQEGAQVIISSRKPENVHKATKNLQEQGLNVQGLICHVSNPEHRKNLFQIAADTGGLDILVSNAAVNPSIGKPILDITEKEWDKTFDVNVRSSFLLAKDAAPLLRKSNAGRVILISSISAYNPTDFLGMYSVTKTTLSGLVKAVALHLGPDNVTVNSVAPGPSRTKFGNYGLNTEKQVKSAVDKTMLGRLGEPKEVAGVVAMLASDDGSYITGENIVVAGGMASRL